MMRRFHVTLAAVALAAGLLPAGPAPATQAAEVDLVDVSLDSSLHFSPNGDGAHDRAVLRFRVLERARVVVEIYRGSRLLLHTDLGTLDQGHHRWMWNGRPPGGARVPDGYYVVALRATRDGRTERTFDAVLVDTANEGRLGTGRRTVYPRADVVDDRIQVVLVEDGWNPYDAEYGDIWQARTRLRITDGKGRVVWRKAVKGASTPVFEWDGTDGDGHALAAGTYHARVRAVDDAGNVLRHSTRLLVSSAQLAERVRSITTGARAQRHYEPYFGGCNGCGDVCTPVSSTRFPGGLSYRPCPSESFFFTTRGYYTAQVPVQAAPVDEFRISVTGGPTTPGGLDHGTLVAGGQATDVTGEGTTTSEWYPVTLDAYPYLPGLLLPVNWSFDTDTPDSYDLATFTVEYRHYALAD